MQPLKILAIAMGAVPIAAFLLTLFLTNGAPLMPLSPGEEESEPVAATPAQPQISQAGPQRERHGRVTATGYADNDGSPVEQGDETPAESATLIIHDRDALLFRTLFGVPNPYVPPAP